MSTSVGLGTPPVYTHSHEMRLSLQHGLPWELRLLDTFWCAAIHTISKIWLALITPPKTNKHAAITRLHHRKSVLFPAQGGSRHIPRGEGEAYATSKGWIYMESSAKDVVGIQSSFELLMMKILERSEAFEVAAAKKAQDDAEWEQRSQQSQQSTRSCNLMCAIC